MCTLVVAVDLYPAVPLFVAANRDERLDRASSGPMLWPGPPKFVAPRDEVAGGTWLGLNEHGLFVGVTNRAGTPPDPRRQSRGTLVLETLHAPTAAKAHQQLARLSGNEHNPFHLFYGDRQSAHLTWSDGTTLTQANLAPGLHVITERSPGLEADTPRAARIRRAWNKLPAAATGSPAIADVQALLSQHDPNNPLDAVCVHADAVGYGTRSSMVLALHDAPNELQLWWSEARPCTTAFTDISKRVQDWLDLESL
jgi:uncharacterized protein with NRDE domain